MNELGSGFLETVLFTILPFVMVCVLLVYLLHYSRKQNRKYLDRSLDHMNALEKKTDRVIQLLEEINKRK